MNTGHTCLSTLTAAFLAVSTYAGGGGPWSDNFDSYKTGSQIAGQGGWEAWDLDGDAEAGFVTSEQAFSGANSLAIDSVGGALADDIVQMYSVADGIWVMSAMVYVPGDMTGQNSYLVLNQYSPDVVANENWSTWVHFNTATGLVRSEFEGATIPLVTDQWVEIRVLIDMEQDLQTVTFDGVYLIQKSWREGVSGGGTDTIQALDLYGDSGSAVYYDDLSLTEAPAAGACCLPDGSCNGDDVDQATCEADGGTYQGNGSVCAAADALLACLAIGDCGTILNLPDETGSNFSLSGNTCGGVSGCDLIASNDFQAEVVLPFDAEWTISICGSLFDTWLKIGSDCCTQDIFNLDDQAGCGNGLQSAFTGDLKAGTYYVTIEGINQAGCGEYTLDISTPCILEAPKGASDEGEPDCGLPADTTNSGCNDLDLLLFNETFCGDVIAGSSGYDGAIRDTDWYTLVVDEDTTVNLTMTSEDANQLGFVQYNAGFEGSGDCTQLTGAVTPFTATTACGTGAVSSNLTPGIWWVWVAPPFADLLDCPSDYILTVECEGDETCTWDLSGDGTVNGTDLIVLLGSWGNPYGTADLIELLGAWGDCE